MTPAEAFEMQAIACGKLGSRFMQTLMCLCGLRLSDSSSVGERILNWEGDIGPHAQSVPLRLAGGLHALKLMGDPDLVAVYPPNTPYPPTDAQRDALWDAVEGALTKHEAFLMDWLKSAPQTNEVRRSAILLAGAAVISKRTGLPLSLFELGASGGLNLNFDKYALDTPYGPIGSPNPALTLSPEWESGAPAPYPFQVSNRRGCDLNPIDPTDPQGRLRLLAYLWPDQPDRIALTQAAISVAKTKVERADALTFLQGALAHAPGQTRVVFHTVAWQYFPKATQTAAQALIEAEGARADAQSPLAWLSMEANESLSAADITLRIWPGDFHVSLGHASFHGKWLRWLNPETTDAT